MELGGRLGAQLFFSWSSFLGSRAAVDFAHWRRLPADSALGKRAAEFLMRGCEIADQAHRSAVPPRGFRWRADRWRTKEQKAATGTQTTMAPNKAMGITGSVVISSIKPERLLANRGAVIARVIAMVVMITDEPRRSQNLVPAFMASAVANADTPTSSGRFAASIGPTLRT